MRNESWLEALDDELRMRGLSADERADAVVEAEGFLLESGADPVEHFGPPAAYAESLAGAVGAARPARRTLTGLPLLEASGVGKAYRARTVLDGVSVSLGAGQLVALVGPNGVGKSTLLRVLAGLERPDAGTVVRHGRVGYVPQAGGLDLYLRPQEHFELFGTCRGRSRRAARREGERLARELGWDAASAPVAAKLSGGTRQKLSVIAALIGEPEVLLLDEPYQGMDADSTRRLWDLLGTWCDGPGAAIVASHQADAIARADTVVELAGAGR
jgi:ABC-type multidrug transport system ATPase subunit